MSREYHSTFFAVSLFRGAILRSSDFFGRAEVTRRPPYQAGGHGRLTRRAGLGRRPGLPLVALRGYRCSPSRKKPYRVRPYFPSIARTASIGREVFAHQGRLTL